MPLLRPKESEISYYTFSLVAGSMSFKTSACFSLLVCVFHKGLSGEEQR